MTANAAGARATGSPAAAQLLVADSFRVRVHGGRAEARGFPLHVARFRHSALAAAADAGGPDGFAAGFTTELDLFLETAADRIAAAGAGFPRLELWRDGAGPGTGGGGALAFDLLLRPIPELSGEIALRTAWDASPLPHPERKGPGIAAYAALGAELGAEPLLVDADGVVLEGGTTSLLWWVGDEACYAAPQARVASVTERLVLNALQGLGVRVSADTATPDELARTEVWALNALHGIRRVTSIDGHELPPRRDASLLLAQTALDACFAPIG